MQSRFQTMSDSIITTIDGMGTRINDLEQSINDLRAEMGVEGSPSPLAPSKQKPCEDKQEEEIKFHCARDPCFIDSAPNKVVYFFLFLII
ncbi:hypothetical protein MANES_05G064201v8 [Manihot esculenta]|uniref:Uncharacterized protein n=1 Tax=Manihot esculenta TaxID=3983 RepID=A0ACB7HSD9_MANES|nr:hypothetical protein MANES_05G064201v8 [Manihot esculenta]